MKSIEHLRTAHETWQTNPGSFARHLGFSLAELLRIVNLPDHKKFVRLRIYPANPTAKVRDVVSPFGAFRKLQQSFLVNVPQRIATCGDHLHGSVAGRSSLTNARVHVGNSFIFRADIRNFFPSVSMQRVKIKMLELGFNASVAGLATKICTVDNHIAQGLITSPAIGNLVLQSVDARLLAVAAKFSAVYTRFVDDFAFSAQYDLAASALPKHVYDVIHSAGFETKDPAKIPSGSIRNPNVRITGNRLTSTSAVVYPDYVFGTETRINQMVLLSTRPEACTEYYTEQQLLGQVNYISITMPCEANRLYKLIRKIDWPKAHENAIARNIVQCKTRLVKLA
jgi:RNA-directed DNA polymerase